jgi:hypothetical protein
LVIVAELIGDDKNLNLRPEPEMYLSTVTLPVIVPEVPIEAVPVASDFKVSKPPVVNVPVTIIWLLPAATDFIPAPLMVKLT